MTPTLKRILRTLGTVLGWILLLLLIGIPLSFLLFLALLSGLVPLYVLLPLLSVAAAGILAALLRRWCRPGPRGAARNHSRVRPGMSGSRGVDGAGAPTAPSFPP